jgi:hypothetical protein
MPTKRTDVERELRERATEEKRQGSGSTPTEDVIERALEVEPGVEWHAGEDAGEVPEREDEEGEGWTGANPT